MPLKFFSLVLLSLPALAQQAVAPDPTLQALLNEVHALRIAVEKSNQIVPRIHIALARMQFQEQRVRDAARQVEAVHGEITQAQNNRVRFEGFLKVHENRLSQAVDPKVRIAEEDAIKDGKAEMERMISQESQLQAREAEANSTLNSEQAKWNEINDLLASIERALK